MLLSSYNGETGGHIGLQGRGPYGSGRAREFLVSFCVIWWNWLSLPAQRAEFHAQLRSVVFLVTHGKVSVMSYSTSTGITHDNWHVHNIWNITGL